MKSPRMGYALVTLAVLFSVVFAAAQDTTQDAASGSGLRSNHWTIPETAAAERNPLPKTAQTVDTGKRLFATHCAHCHGASGRNDGPDSDRERVNADLTDADRAGINPDGVVFYKIWNGRGGAMPDERMPGFGFNGRLTRDDVWAVVAYVQTLRAANGAR